MAVLNIYFDVVYCPLVFFLCLWQTHECKLLFVQPEFRKKSQSTFLKESCSFLGML